jgi:hypothetical protein
MAVSSRIAKATGILSASANGKAIRQQAKPVATRHATVQTSGIDHAKPLAQHQICWPDRPEARRKTAGPASGAKRDHDHDDARTGCAIPGHRPMPTRLSVARWPSSYCTQACAAMPPNRRSRMENSPMDSNSVHDQNPAKDWRKDKLRIGTLPQQEVRHPVLSTGPDDQIRDRGCQRSASHPQNDPESISSGSIFPSPAASASAHCLNDLVASAIIEGDDQCHARVIGGQRSASAISSMISPAILRAARSLAPECCCCESRPDRCE